MKKLYRNIIIVAIISFLSLTAGEVFAFDPPQPPDDHGESGDQPPGGGAPISGGIGFFVAMAAAYGTYRLKKQHSEINR